MSGADAAHGAKKDRPAQGSHPVARREAPPVPAHCMDPPARPLMASCCAPRMEKDSVATAPAAGVAPEGEAATGTSTTAGSSTLASCTCRQSRVTQGVFYVERKRVPPVELPETRWLVCPMPPSPRLPEPPDGRRAGKSGCCWRPWRRWQARRRRGRSKERPAWCSAWLESSLRRGEWGWGEWGAEGEGKRGELWWSVVVVRVECPSPSFLRSAC